MYAFLRCNPNPLPERRWDRVLKGPAASYEGAEVFTAEALEFDRVVEALPPPAFAATVPVDEVTVGLLRAQMMDPLLVLLPESERPLPPARPR